MIRKKKILFIEDEAELVAMMKMRLEANNYEMISAFDGEDGLKKIKEESPDLILLDIIIPKIDGLTLCKSLKRGPETKHIPVIVISASGGRDLPQRCEEAGADELIIKPFEAKDVLESIARWLKEGDSGE